MNPIKDAFLILRVPSDLKSKLIKMAKKAGARGISDYVRDLLEKHTTK